jgi:FAD/FMN-containing dehydrogenase
MTDLIQQLQAIVGAAHVIAAPDEMAPYLREWRDLYRGQALCVVKPGSTAEVAAVVKTVRAAGATIVPQGGNTGLVGGQIPMGAADGGKPEIVLSLTRMTRIREVDAATDTLIVDAGVTLAAAQTAAEEAGRLFPLSLASEGSCTIGGTISTNAGGTAVLAYGTMRDLVMGLEVVLADGRIWNGLSKLRKDNTGYDLRHLFIGAEGTLGIVTGAVLKLFPLPAARATTICGLPSPEAALGLLMLTKEKADGALTTFEFMPRMGLDFVLRHAEGTRDPLAQPHPWYALMELSGADDGALDARLQDVLGAGIEQGIVSDAALAASLDQRESFWRLREMLSEVQRFEGGSIKHDISVPVAQVPAFLAQASAAVAAMVPGCRPVPFGHMGDGNVHFNVSQPIGADKAAFLARWDEMNAAVHAIVSAYGGSISAEHGIGRLKKHLLPGVKDPVALDLMRAIKATLDPDGLFNPGAVLPDADL